MSVHLFYKRIYDLQAVTAGDVAKILATMPAKIFATGCHAYITAETVCRCVFASDSATGQPELRTGTIPSALQVGISLTITEETAEKARIHHGATVRRKRNFNMKPASCDSIEAPSAESR